MLCAGRSETSSYRSQRALETVKQMEFGWVQWVSVPGILGCSLCDGEMNPYYYSIVGKMGLMDKRFNLFE